MDFDAPRRSDVAAGTGILVVSVALLLTAPLFTSLDANSGSIRLEQPGSAPWLLVLFTLIVQCALLLFSRQAPSVVVVAVAGATLLLGIAHPGSLYTLTSLPVLAAVFLAAFRAPFRRLGVSLLAACLLLTIGGTLNGVAAGPLDIALLEASAQGVFIVGISTLIGSVARGRSELRLARDLEVRALAREQEALVAAAVARERTAMARELHDIAAHHLSGIAIMASAIDRQIVDSPDTARANVRQLRTQSTEVLDDLRRLVGLLREDPESERAVRSIAAISDLVDEARARGPVELRIHPRDADTDGVTPELAAGVGALSQMAVYRTVQEALSNAATHAPGASCVVEIDDRAPASVTVTVTNAPPAAPVQPSATGGFGLVGMRERASLVGARLHYGPTDAGGWAVRIAATREDSLSTDTERQPR